MVHMEKFIRLSFDRNKIVDWGISSSNYIRYLYMATFLSYDGTLKSGNNALMTKEMCKERLRLREDTFRSFYKECLDAKLFEVDEQTQSIKLPNSLVSRDTRDIKENDKVAILININMFRDLYFSVDLHSHKTMSYMFRCLPLYDFERNRFILNNQELSIKDCFSLFKITADRNIHARYKTFIVNNEPVFSVQKIGEKSYYILNNKLFSNQFDMRRPRALSPNYKHRQSETLKAWRKSVLQRDNYTCQCCGGHINLNAHHIKNYAQHKDLALDIDNGITLCELCHNPFIAGSFHNIYGTYNNTFEQLQEYIENHSYIRKILNAISENKLVAKEICLSYTFSENN